MKKKLFFVVSACIALMICVIGCPQPSISAPPPVIPAPVAPTKGTVTDTSIIINWTAVDDAVGYNVHLGDSGAEVKKNTDLVTNTTYTIAGLTANTEYKISLKAEHSAGESDFSPVLTVKTMALPAPLAPTKGIVKKTSIIINWTAVDSAVSYDVYHNTVNDSADATKVNDITGTTHTMKGLTAGTNYYIWLKAKNEAGSSGFSPVLEVTPVTASPTVPTKGTVTDTSIAISWDAVTGADDYDVYHNTTNDSADATKVNDITGTTHTIEGLTASTTYYIWLKAKNTAGESGFSPVLE